MSKACLGHDALRIKAQSLTDSDVLIQRHRLLASKHARQLRVVDPGCLIERLERDLSGIACITKDRGNHHPEGADLSTSARHDAILPYGEIACIAV